MPILLMTRARAASDQFVSRLDSKVMQGIRVIYAPLLEIVPSAPVPDIAGYSGVVFTSSNGAKLASNGGGRMAYCVGVRTAQTAKMRGWQVALVAQDADELVLELPKILPTGRLLHIAGAHRRGEIAERLTALRIPTEVHVAYTQPLLPLSKDAKNALFGEVVVIVPLFSPRIAAHFASQAADVSNVDVLAISQAAADALGESFGGSVQIASDPTGYEMQCGIENMLRGTTLA
jgi:uroporphyrinogen-III synthase